MNHWDQRNFLREHARVAQLATPRAITVPLRHLNPATLGIKQERDQFADAMLRKEYLETGVEVWAAIAGFEGSYEISSFGNVRSLDRATVLNGIKGPKSAVGVSISQAKNRNGYLYFVATAANKKKHVSSHRAVASAFVPNPENKPQVNHKDGNPANNVHSNLEWVTRGENLQHAYRVLGREPSRVSGDRHGRSTMPERTARGEANGFSVVTEREVVEMRIKYSSGCYSLRQLGRLFGVSNTTVGNIVTRKSWAHVALSAEREYEETMAGLPEQPLTEDDVDELAERYTEGRRHRMFHKHNPHD